MLSKSKVIFAKLQAPIITATQRLKFSTKASKNVKLQPIDMSFASYENTLSQTGHGPPPVIIMHGLFGSKANWNSLCKALHQHTAPQRKIIAVDARNHGDSPHSKSHTYVDLAEDVKALLDQLKVQKSCLLGHSMGGRAVMYFSLKYPEYVDKLIVADISPISTSQNFKSVGRILIIMQKVNLPKNVPLSSAKRIVDLQLSSSINDKGLRAFILTNMVQKSDGSYTWRVNLPALAENLSKHILGFPDVGNFKFDGPALFIAGGKSDFIQKTDHVAILKLFPKAEFKVVEGAGHWLHSEKPKEFLQVCLDFLNTKPEK